MAPTVVNYGGTKFTATAVNNLSASTAVTVSSATGCWTGMPIFDATTPGAIPSATYVVSIAGNILTLSNTSMTSIGSTDVLIQPEYIQYSAGTLNPVWGKTTTPGNTLILVNFSSAWASGNHQTVTWTNSSVALDPGTTSNWGWGIWYITGNDNTMGTTTGPSVVLPTGGVPGWCYLLEVTGLDAASPLDQVNWKGANTNPNLSNPAADAAAGDFFIGAQFWEAPNSSSTLTVNYFRDSTGTAISPYYQADNINAQWVANGGTLYAQNWSALWGVCGLGALSQGDSISQTFTGSPGNNTITLASFKAASGGGGGSLACTNLAQVAAGGGSTSPNTNFSGSVSVTAGDLLVVPTYGWNYGSASIPSFSVSATGSGWGTWASVAPVRFNGAYSGSSQAFIAVVPVGVSSTVISVTITDASATEVSVGFNVDQISGQGTIGTPNGVSATADYTGTPGSALDITATATTSLVYAWLAADSAYTASVTAQPSGFTETALFDSAAGPANTTLSCAYKIGSSISPTAYPWTVATNAYNIVGLLEVPVGGVNPVAAPAAGVGARPVPGIGVYPPIA